MTTEERVFLLATIAPAVPARKPSVDKKKPTASVKRLKKIKR